MSETERSSIPSKEFDREYNTQWRREMEFLRAKGIEYTFAKRVGEYKIPTYKYKKTPQLFLALAEFYNQQQFRKNMDAIDKAVSEIMPLEKGYIEIKPDKAEAELLKDAGEPSVCGKVVSNEELADKLSAIKESAVPAEEIQKAIDRLQDDTI